MNAGDQTGGAWLDTMYRYPSAESYRNRETEERAGTSPVTASRPLTVASVMSPDPITVRLTTPYKEIANLLRDNAISAVPVLNAFREPVGVVSEADLIAKHTYLSGQRKPSRLAKDAYARWNKARAQIAKDLMTSPVQTIDADASLLAATEKLVDTGTRRLFVTEDGRLTGVLSRRDLLRVFTTTDEELTEAVDEQIAKHGPWSRTTELCVTVSAGVVTLLGSVPRRSDGRRLGELAQAVPGVVAVRNRLSHDADDLAPGLAAGQ